MDADLVSALGSTPTPLEKLYAEAIEDNRVSTVKWDEERQKLAAFRATMTDWAAWMKAEYAKLPPETLSDEDRMYERCVMAGLEIRKQAMTTATSQATMDDVINDGFRMGDEIYRRLQARRAQGTAP